jgi:Peptidase family M28
MRERHVVRARLAGIALMIAALTGCVVSSTNHVGEIHDVHGPSSPDAPPALALIREDEIRRDLFALAGDAMRGREAGTLDELRASVWVAERAREAGLLPAGEDGSYFQWWPMRRVRTSQSSTVNIDGRPLALWREVIPAAPTAGSVVDAPLVYVGEGRESDLAGRDIKGKAVVAILSAPVPLPAPNVSLRGYRYTLTAVRQRSAYLLQRGASAVVLVSDSVADAEFERMGTILARGRYNVDSADAGVVVAQPPVLWVRRAMLDQLRGGTARLSVTLVAESFVYPSVNVVAKVPGTDPARRDEYVLFSGHQDHDGVRFPVNGDSIWNGADDNASVSVGMLSIARAWSARPGARSALFVWHGAEERGLLGSRWFVAHPTVPRASIAAVLNADMIGRNSPDSAALLGVQPPHRNSSALVAMALAANASVSRFALDTTWDRPSHLEGWYFRSDHLPYARAGVPSLFFTTLLHPDYHTPKDEPDRIDVAKLARVARWMYATGWMVSETPARPGVDAGFRLER